MLSLHRPVSLYIKATDLIPLRQRKSLTNPC